MRGYFGIGVENSKTRLNMGTLWRSAKIFGASFMFTIGRRYKRQPTDTLKAWRHVPLYHYEDIPHFAKSLPYNCKIIGIEIDSKAVPVERFVHPERAIYLLGAEDHGLTAAGTDLCHALVQIETEYCLNVAVAGSIVMYDRATKQ